MFFVVNERKSFKMTLFSNLYLSGDGEIVVYADVNKYQSGCHQANIKYADIC